MAVYIKTPDGLKRISNEDIEAKDIEKALGYTPSDFSGNYQDLNNAPDIFDDASGVLVIADQQGNIILKIDNEGLHTTDVEIDGMSVKHKLENMDSLTDDSDTLYVTDGSGNIIAKIDKDGVSTTQVNAKQVILDGESIEDKLENPITSIDENADDDAFHLVDNNGNIIFTVDSTGVQAPEFYNPKKSYKVLETLEQAVKDIEDLREEVDNIDIPDFEIPAEVTEHIANQDIHVTAEKKAEWDAKSNFSGNYNDLTNKPVIPEGSNLDITNDNDNELVLVDTNGNVILRIDENGVNTTAYYEKGKKVINDFGSNGSSGGATEEVIDYPLSADNTYIDITTLETDKWYKLYVPNSAVNGYTVTFGQWNSALYGNIKLFVTSIGYNLFKVQMSKQGAYDLVVKGAYSEVKELDLIENVGQGETTLTNYNATRICDDIYVVVEFSGYQTKFHNVGYERPLYRHNIVMSNIESSMQVRISVSFYDYSSSIKNASQVLNILVPSGAEGYDMPVQGTMRISDAYYPLTFISKTVSTGKYVLYYNEGTKQSYHEFSYLQTATVIDKISEV